MKQGIEQGISGGIMQGIEQGQEEIVRRQLRRRFGDLPEEISARIASLSRVQLGDFAESFFDFKDLSDARSWLLDHDSR